MLGTGKTLKAEREKDARRVFLNKHTRVANRESVESTILDLLLDLFDAVVDACEYVVLPLANLWNWIFRGISVTTSLSAVARRYLGI